MSQPTNGREQWDGAALRAGRSETKAETADFTHIAIASKQLICERNDEWRVKECFPFNVCLHGCVGSTNPTPFL